MYIHYILLIYLSRNPLAKFLHVFELMGSVSDIVTKPRTSVSERVPEGFFVDISTSPFVFRFLDDIHLKQTKIFGPSSAVDVRFFSMRRRGIIDTAKTCSRGQEDNTSQPEPPKVLRTTVRLVFILFKDDPASKSRFLKDSSIIPAFASVVQTTKSRFPLIFRFVHPLAVIFPTSS